MFDVQVCWQSVPVLGHNIWPLTAFWGWCKIGCGPVTQGHWHWGWGVAPYPAAPKSPVTFQGHLALPLPYSRNPAASLALPLLPRRYSHPGLRQPLPRVAAPGFRGWGCDCGSEICPSHPGLCIIFPSFNLLQLLLVIHDAKHKAHAARCKEMQKAEVPPKGFTCLWATGVKVCGIPLLCVSP